MDRRAAFSTIAGAAAVISVPQFAFADGAVSNASKEKARLKYGDRIIALKSAVESGNFDAVAAEKSAFILYNSGTYPTAKDKPLKAKAVAGTNAIFSAVKSGDKAALKTAYTAYIASNGIKPLPSVDSDKGQGYSSDFDYRRRTKSGAIYVR
jgi:Photosystem II Psb31 protein